MENRKMFIEKESKQCNYEIEENKDSITFEQS